jgi:hypothetical protein
MNRHPPIKIDDFKEGSFLIEFSGYSEQVKLN